MGEPKDIAGREEPREDAVRPTPRMVIAARGLLSLSQQDLADAAGVSFSALRRFESGSESTRLGTLTKLAVALNARGIRFRVMDGEVQVALVLPRRP
jgi:transcriptional regulator with XRE-family HTH domain